MRTARNVDTSRLELHVFQHEGYFFAFDVRTFSILKIDAPTAAVLSKMQNLSLILMEAELRPHIQAPLVRRIYRQFLKLARVGVLSTEPLPRPAHPTFDHIVLMLAGGCNMGCTYCFEKYVPVYQNPNLLTQEKAKEILDWFCRYQEGKKAHVQLYGGEPLLNWPVLQYVIRQMEIWKQEKGLELTLYLITNGTLLNPERTAFLKFHNVAIQVSADGDAETHDRFRVFKSGKPTMDSVKRNIGDLVMQGARFNVRAVLTRHNKDPKSVIDGLRSLGAEKVSFEVVATDCMDAQFSEGDWEAFNREYRKVVYEPYTIWGRLPAEMQSMIIRICEHRLLFYGCGAGVSEVTVAPDGSIYECQRMYQDPCSNVSEDKSLAAIDSRFLTMVDERPICKDCWARYLCGGGCMHQAHMGHGKGEPLPQFCVMKRNLAEASIVKISEIRSLSKAATS